MYNFAAFKISTRVATVLFFRVFQLCFLQKTGAQLSPFGELCAGFYFGITS